VLLLVLLQEGGVLGVVVLVRLVVGGSERVALVGAGQLV